MVVKVTMTPIGLTSAAVSAKSWLLQVVGVGPQEATVPRGTTGLLTHDSTPGSLGIIQYASGGLSSLTSRVNMGLLEQSGNRVTNKRLCQYAA